MREIKLVFKQGHRRAGGSHTMQIGILVGVLLDAMMRGLEALEKPAAGIPGVPIGVDLFESLTRGTAGSLSTFVSAHAIGHDGQTALPRELRIAGRFPVGIAVFI